MLLLDARDRLLRYCRFFSAFFIHPFLGIKRIILLQAVVLAAIGIPVGAVAGYLLGIVITRVTAVNMDGIVMVSSIDPLIFVGASLFSLITVYLSCGNRLEQAIEPHIVGDRDAEYIVDDQIARKHDQKQCAAIGNMTWRWWQITW